MKERPILFRPENVRTILSGKKTQTRRVMEPQPGEFEHVDFTEAAGWFLWGDFITNYGTNEVDQWESPLTCPYGAVGDRLWVREPAWYDKEPLPMLGNQRRVFFVDTNQVTQENGNTGPSPSPLSDEMFRVTGLQVRKPGIHMPRWASRLTLEITGIRLERVQEISNVDARAEGVDAAPHRGPHGGPCTFETGVDQCFGCSYRFLWNVINGARGFGWEKNPWVWVIEFRRVQ